MHLPLKLLHIAGGTLIAAAFLLGFLPTAAAADSITASRPSITDAQLLKNVAPCASPTVSVTPYIYNGSMDSFDLDVSDGSYVSLAGQVGSFSIPLQLMTRREEGGGVRIHVDIPSTPIYGAVPVSITMLSAQQGICAATVSFTVQGPAAPVATTPANPTTGEQQSGPTGTGISASSTASSTSALPAVSGTIVAGPFSSIAGSISSICEFNQGAFELWLTLLAIFFVFVMASLFANVPSIRESETLAIALIFVPFLALFAFWYGVPECRTAPWTGIVACVIAIGGLVALYGEEAVEKMKQLPAPQTLPAIAAPAARTETKKEEKASKKS